ncbi:MAG: hypothetical protein HKM95_15385 [Inquilinus sp.]|nr:hypothetical protein [Inquilinus sp.]
MLVAFAIMAVALSGLTLAFSSGLRAVDRSAAVADATLRAQSLLDEVGITIPLDGNGASGRFDDGTGWSVAIVPFDPDQRRQARSRSTLIYRVEVVVEPAYAAPVALTSLRLGPVVE